MPKRPALPRDVLMKIGFGLQARYEDSLYAPAPVEWREMLRKIDGKPDALEAR